MSYYPLVLSLADIDVYPVLGELAGDPYLHDFASDSAADYETTDFPVFQDQVFDEIAEAGHEWAIGLYLENRSGLLRNFPQMISEGRIFHVGLDVTAPANTSVFAPIPGVVEKVGFDGGVGNYGGFLILKHEMGGVRFYSFYGHLRRPHVVKAGQEVAAGEKIAALGEHEDSGGWFSHVHLQVLTQEAFDQGRILQGYVDAEALQEIESLFPSPYPLFRARSRSERSRSESR